MENRKVNRIQKVKSDKVNTNDPELRASCPYCGAQPGKPCLTPNYKVRKEIHSARILAD